MVPNPRQTSKNVSSSSSENQVEAKRWTYRVTLILALAVPNFLAAADTTIVAPAIELISQHFNQVEGTFSWLVTAYTLTNTAFTPLSGQIVDIYGRHAALQFHIFWLLIGSVLCAVSQTWGMLLLGRALQGIGASGIQNLTDIILSDGVTLAENARNNTIFTFVNGIGFACGPVIGGYVANASWRYLFVLSVGVAFLSHLIIFLLLRNNLRGGSINSSWQSRFKGLQTFDIFGTIIFLFGTGLLILAVSWGGTAYPWSSVSVIIPMILGGILFISFFGYEYLMSPGRFMARFLPKQSALVPVGVFREKDAWLLSIINFATGAALFSAFYFSSLYWTIAEGYDSKRAGIQLLYYTPGLGGGAWIAMAMCNVWPARTFDPLLLGSVVEAVGMGLLAYAVDGRRSNLVHGFMAMAGAGSGLRFMPIILHASGLWSENWRASILSLLSFWTPFGGTIAIAMMGAVYTNSFRNYIDGIVSSLAAESNTPTNPSGGFDFNNIPPNLRGYVRDAAAKALKWAFVSTLPFMVLSAIAAFFLGNVWVKEKTSQGYPARVLEGIYLKAVVQGNVNDKCKIQEDAASIHELGQRAHQSNDGTCNAKDTRNEDLPDV